MSNDMQQTLSNHAVRQTVIQIDEVIKCLSLAQDCPGVDDNAAAVIMLSKRQLAKAADELIEMFGADWPENK